MKFCERCKTEKAAYFCVECKNSLCKACDEYVHKLKRYTVHNRVLVDEVDTINGFCNYHPYEAATHYCSNCKSTFTHTHTYALN